MRARVAIAFAVVVSATCAATGRPTFAKDPPTAAPPPSFPFWLRRVAPWMDERCATCHRGTGSGLRLEVPAQGADEVARRRREFEGVSRFVDREAPWASRLLRKVIPEDEGGLPHAGGAHVRPTEDFYDDLLDFACGATPENLPPEPEPGKDRRILPGEPVRLDGTLSYDRDDDPVSFRWELLARPPGSTAALTGDLDPMATLRPDVGGTYVVRLRVFDGKAWSPWKPVVLEALERVGPESPDPVASSGLEAVDPKALRLVRSVYGDVLGRPPTPPEAIASAGRPAGTLAVTLLATVEAGRAWAEDVSLRLGMTGDAEPSGEVARSLPLRLAGDGMSPAAAERALALDPGFLRAHPPGEGLARAIETELLERPGSEEERTSWRDPAALPAVLASAEFEVAALRRLARRFLPADAAAAIPASRAREGIFSLARSFVASPEYAGGGDSRRRASPAAFVRALYADLLGRRPTSAELAAFVRALSVLPESSAGRAAAVAILLDSGEALLPLVIDLTDPDAWLRDRFLRFLGRRPGAEEATAYRAALLDPAGGPHVVVRALLTGTEYASR